MKKAIDEVTPELEVCEMLDEKINASGNTVCGFHDYLKAGDVMVIKRSTKEVTPDKTRQKQQKIEYDKATKMRFLQKK